MPKNLYYYRNIGREACMTEGSDHYKLGDIEPFDLIIAKGMAVDFSLANVIKYAARYKETKNIKDLMKISDYAHILCGIEIEKEGRNKNGKD